MRQAEGVVCRRIALALALVSVSVGVSVALLSVSVIDVSESRVGVRSGRFVCTRHENESERRNRDRASPSDAVHTKCTPLCTAVCTAVHMSDTATLHGAQVHTAAHGRRPFMEFMHATHRMQSQQS